MKEFSSEFGQSYHTYSFGYCNYALYEKGDDLSVIYDKGYLPFSGSSDIRNAFYMSRSARIPLRHFHESSENRRIEKRFHNAFKRKVTPLDKFDWDNKEFISFCTKYFSMRHGPAVMPEKRIRHILKCGLVTHIVSYADKDNKIVGYVFEISDSKLSHFWFSFYDLSYVYRSLGVWLMLDCLRHAKVKGKEYFYVGTVYGEKALYKSNFNPIEFWNGIEWVKDVKKLKSRSRSDEERIIHGKDEWKEEINIF